MRHCQSVTATTGTEAALRWLKLCGFLATMPVQANANSAFAKQKLCIGDSVHVIANTKAQDTGSYFFHYFRQVRAKRQRRCRTDFTFPSRIIASQGATAALTRNSSSPVPGLACDKSSSQLPSAHRICEFVPLHAPFRFGERLTSRKINGTGTAVPEYMGIVC